MAKALYLMTGAEIAKAYAKASEATSKICTALIEANRGMERGSETRAKSDPLSLDYIRENDRFTAIIHEMDARKRYHGGTQRIIRQDHRETEPWQS